MMNSKMIPEEMHNPEYLKFESVPHPGHTSFCFLRSKLVPQLMQACPVSFLLSFTTVSFLLRVLLLKRSIQN